MVENYDVEIDEDEKWDDYDPEDMDFGETPALATQKSTGQNIFSTKENSITFKYKMMSIGDIMRERESKISELVDMMGLSEDLASALLLKHNWLV
jgi:hypothetical protein